MPQVTYLTPMDGEGSVRSGREDPYYQSDNEKNKLVSAVPIPADAECVDTTVCRMLIFI